MECTLAASLNPVKPLSPVTMDDMEECRERTQWRLCGEAHSPETKWQRRIKEWKRLTPVKGESPAFESDDSDAFSPVSAWRRRRGLCSEYDAVSTGCNTPSTFDDPWQAASDESCDDWGGEMCDPSEPNCETDLFITSLLSSTTDETDESERDIVLTPREDVVQTPRRPIDEVDCHAPLTDVPSHPEIFTDDVVLDERLSMRKQELEDAEKHIQSLEAKLLAREKEASEWLALQRKLMRQMEQEQEDRVRTRNAIISNINIMRLEARREKQAKRKDSMNFLLGGCSCEAVDESIEEVIHPHFYVKPLNE